MSAETVNQILLAIVLVNTALVLYLARLHRKQCDLTDHYRALWTQALRNPPPTGLVEHDNTEMWRDLANRLQEGE
jgi:hypothetical protein